MKSKADLAADSSPAPEHPAAQAHHRLTELRDAVTRLIGQLEELFPHLAASAPEVIKDAETVAQATSDAKKTITAV